MENLDKIMVRLKIPTNELDQEILQDLLITFKKYGTALLEDKLKCNEMEYILFQHLETGLNKFDDQLLCATCYYTILALRHTTEGYLTEILEILKEEICLREKSGKETTRTSLAVSLIYGLFQSSFLASKNINKVSDIEPVLLLSFQLLSKMSYEYSKYTFIVFKALSLLKKILNTSMCKYLFTQENLLKLLNIVNHNWENPITGVRDLNKVIFQTILCTLEKSMLKNLLDEINRYHWNKAKYLMLAEIVNYPDLVDIDNELLKTHWLKGLVLSLNKPGLISAGTDLYFAIFKKLQSQEEWCTIFMEPILEILNGDSKKAVDNFCNYWCTTTFKSYPELCTLLINELLHVEGLIKRCTTNTSKHYEEKLFSCLCLMKAANKIGLITKNWNSKEIEEGDIELLITNALDNCNNHIRMNAFEILCVSNSKAMPTGREYDLILKYVTYNLNSDCTVLRISMINSLTCFLSQLHISYRNNMKKIEEQDATNFQKFCSKFQKCIIENLKIGGNYQRKITCIKLAQIFLHNLNEVPKKKKMQTKVCDVTVIQMLKDNGVWIMDNENFTTILINLLKDPAEDIRENVGKLLLAHYSTELRKTNVLNDLIKTALKCMQSKFFYDTNCGQGIIKVIVTLLSAQDQPEAVFKNVSDVFNYAFNELIAEYRLKRGVVESIIQGKQLHSFMSILQGVLEVCHDIEYKISISDETVMELLDVLQGIANQFAWKEEASTSSDFGKMSDMVKMVIFESGYDSSNGEDVAYITGLEKIVLMCLWLNVKGSCELSSLIIKLQEDDSQVVICEKALGTISHVLEMCRHKGAIEAAGAALGQAIQHLTSLPETSKISKLPLNFLKRKLDELITEAKKMASITRRGAGLSIMVHRIVSSDMNRGKPLFHYFMEKILTTCNMTEDIPSTLTQADVDNEKDLPKAIFIHFLTKIVTDSTLASHVLYYSAELAELAFGNLTNPHWQIRNAALQLYGALIQKLIGQKKISGSQEETIATVACDELRTHSPKLWSYILSKVQSEDDIQKHSSLVPILNMLASLAPRYNFTSEMLTENDETTESLLPHLLFLLGSPIYSVRRLTADAIYNIYPFDTVLNYCDQNAFESENKLHGSLLLIDKYSKLRDSSENSFNDIRRKYEEVFENRKHSYLCKSVFESIFPDDEPTIIIDTLKELQENSHAPGVHLWANGRIRKYIQNATWEMIPQLLQIVLICKDYEKYCEYFLEKIDHAVDVDQKIIKHIVCVFLEFEHKFDSGLIWKILYKILQHVSHVWLSDQNFFMDDVYNFLVNHGISYKLRYMLPFVARVVAVYDEHTSTTSIRVNIAKIVESLTDPRQDVEMRYIAALTNNEMAGNLSGFMKSGNGVLLPLIKSAIILLQDEDEEVRMLSAGFYSAIGNCPQTVQPSICLSRLMLYDFLSYVFDCDTNAIMLLAEQLKGFINEHTCCATNDEYNPFSNDSSNIYLEANIIKKTIETWLANIPT